MIKSIESLAANVIPPFRSNPAHIHSDSWSHALHLTWLAWWWWSKRIRQTRSGRMVRFKKRYFVVELERAERVSRWNTLLGQPVIVHVLICSWKPIIDCFSNSNLICSWKPGVNMTLIWSHLTRETVIWLRLSRIRWLSLLLKGTSGLRINTSTTNTLDQILTLYIHIIHALNALP